MVFPHVLGLLTSQTRFSVLKYSNRNGVFTPFRVTDLVKFEGGLGNLVCGSQFLYYFHRNSFSSHFGVIDFWSSYAEDWLM